jgi:NAD(P)-dependent dehydrogenase (short-subunit alcohol dehydrogenase family)
LTLAEQTVVVTGAAQGLGRAVATAFHGAGALVAALDVDERGLESLAHDLSERLHPYRVDLSDAGATQAAAERVLADLGPVHTLVHNAAVLEPQPFEALTFEGWQRTVNVGLQAAFLLTQAVWGGMKTAGGGCVVYVSSRSGIEGFEKESAYCAAKHGLEGLMKALALEGAPHGVLVHTVTPGMYMRTPMSERNYPDELKAKWVEPDALAPAFLTLAERADPGLTGQRLSAWDLARKEKHDLP